ncbi:RtcB family protein, partial [Vibrio parahaemolyticus]
HIDKIIDNERFEQHGFNKKQALLLVHSGSRGLGQSVLRQHVEQHNHSGLLENTDEASAYLLAHQDAL